MTRGGGGSLADKREYYYRFWQTTRDDARKDLDRLDREGLSAAIRHDYYLWWQTRIENARKDLDRLDREIELIPYESQTPPSVGYAAEWQLNSYCVPIYCVPIGGCVPVSVGTNSFGNTATDEPAPLSEEKQKQLFDVLAKKNPITKLAQPLWNAPKEMRELPKNTWASDRFSGLDI